VDYQTKEDQTVTIRFRDSMEQVRVRIAEIAPTVRAAIKEYRRPAGRAGAGAGAAPAGA